MSGLYFPWRRLRPECVRAEGTGERCAGHLVPVALYADGACVLEASKEFAPQLPHETRYVSVAFLQNVHNWLY